jgi:hypothetical protein
MSFFANPNPITKPLDDNHTVTYRKLSWGERQKLDQRVYDSSIPITQDADIDYAKFQLESLKRRLVGWAGPEFDGLPCTPANIEQLSIEAADAILAVVDGKEEVLSDEEKKA